MSKDVLPTKTVIKEQKKVKFAKHYLLYANAALAAESVGHARGENANKAGTRYLKDPFVQQEIARAKAKVADDYGVSKQSIIDRLLFIIDDGDTSSGDRTRAIAELNKMLGFLSPIKNETKLETNAAVIILPDNGAKV